MSPIIFLYFPICLPLGGKGCNGSWPEDAYDYVLANKGQDAEECYPYTAKVCCLVTQIFFLFIDITKEKKSLANSEFISHTWAMIELWMQCPTQIKIKKNDEQTEHNFNMKIMSKLISVHAADVGSTETWHISYGAESGFSRHRRETV